MILVFYLFFYLVFWLLFFVVPIRGRPPVPFGAGRMISLAYSAISALVNLPPLLTCGTPCMPAAGRCACGRGSLRCTGP